MGAPHGSAQRAPHTVCRHASRALFPTMAPRAAPPPSCTPCTPFRTAPPLHRTPHTTITPHLASLAHAQAHYRDHGKFHFARAVLVLHNVAHQGRAPMDDLQRLEVPEHYRELFR